MGGTDGSTVVAAAVEAPLELVAVVAVYEDGAIVVEAACDGATAGDAEVVKRVSLALALLPLDEGRIAK